MSPGLLDQLTGGLGGLNLGGLTGAPLGGQATQQPFKSFVRVTDGAAPFDTMAEVLAIIGALAALSQYTKVWQMAVPAQQKIAWGFGSPAYPHNQGYMWFASLDSGTAFQVGTLRLVQAKARETRSITVAEIDDSRLHTVTSTNLTTATPSDINTMYALPEKVEHPLIGEDSLLQLWYACIAVATTEDDVGWSIPITIYQ